MRAASTLGTWLVASATVLTAGTAAAFQNGVNGYSGQDPVKTCALCHQGQGGTPVAKITGPAALPPGGTGEYTFTLQAPNKLLGGFDVAVDNAAAKLAVVSPKTQLLAGELTHTQPLPIVNGEIVVKFNVTAPDAPGTITLHADGQADNNQQNIKVDSAADPTSLKIAVMVGAPVPDLGGELEPSDMGTAGTGGGGGGAGDTAGDAGVTTPTGGTTGLKAAPKHGCSFADGAGASAMPGVLLVLAGILLLRRRAAGPR